MLRLQFKGVLLVDFVFWIIIGSRGLEVKSQNWTPRTKEKNIGSRRRMLWGVEIELRVLLKVAWARENVALGNQI